MSVHVRLLLSWIAFISYCYQANAYRVGDAIPMTYQTPSEHLDVLRVQRPLFGVSTSAKFDVEDAKRFSLVFEDGIRPLPWIDIQQGARWLESVKITYVYSKSGEGTIEHMSSQTTYAHARKDQGKKFIVDYEWIEEAPVDLTVGAGIMMLLTTLASLIFLLQACGIKEKADLNVQYGGGGGGGYKNY
mmetsp:Transcript_1149/g.1575  ORF Transcript_1149/g.1575 Transcript_1149/m.1575 type:complete len:188 (-) Transcript_1149:164-727(-)